MIELSPPSPLIIRVSDLHARYTKFTGMYLCDLLDDILVEQSARNSIFTLGTHAAFYAAYPEIFAPPLETHNYSEINEWLRSDQAWLRYNMVDTIPNDGQSYRRRFRIGLLQYLIDNHGDRELQIRKFINFVGEIEDV